MNLRRRLSTLILLPVGGVILLACWLIYLVASHQIVKILKEETLEVVSTFAAAIESTGGPDKIQPAVHQGEIPPVSRLYVVRQQRPGAARTFGYAITSIFAHEDIAEPSSDSVPTALQTASEPFAQWVNRRDLSIYGEVTAFAPVKAANGDVVAWVGADSSMDWWNERRKAVVGALVLSAAVMMGVLLAMVRAVTQHISKPVERLKAAALAVAAGGYTEDIAAEGPEEIVDLANTFNTMRAGLQENISHIRESSLVRELMYGEYECSQWLQYYMLDHAVEAFHSPLVKAKTISVASTTNASGFLLETEVGDEVWLRLTEARREGLQGAYDLLYSAPRGVRKAQEASVDGFPTLTLRLGSSGHRIDVERFGMPAPLVWSTVKNTFIEPIGSVYDAQPGDYLFVFNQSFARLIEQSGQVQDWFGRVLNHFDEDGLDGIVPMLSSELEFIGRKLHIDPDVHLLCLHLTPPPL